MSISNRRGNSVAKLAAALCVLSTGASSADAADVPQLVKTTVPVHVDSLPAMADQGDVVRSVKRAALMRHVVQTPSPLARVAVTSGSVHGRADRQGLPDQGMSVPEGTVQQTASGESSPSPIAPARSAAVPQRTHALRTGLQGNPLVADAPPQLRQFHVQPPQYVTPTRDSRFPSDGSLVISPPVSAGPPVSANSRATPPPPADDLDVALDALSVETSSAPAMIGTARGHGFGSLAIDQIGAHLDQSASADDTMNYPPLRRFATDLVMPPPSQSLKLQQPHPLHPPGTVGAFREQLGAIDASKLNEALLPTLPSPTAAKDQDLPHRDAIARSLQVLGQGPVSSPDRPAGTPAMEVAMHNTPGKRAGAKRAEAQSGGDDQNALRVDEWIAASAGHSNPSDPDQDPEDSKPSLTEKFVGWSKRLTFGRTSSQDKPVSARLPSESSGIQATPSRKRTGGILTQWLNRSR
ncbi:hypothetical protein Mal15_45940 [Stieleria maiorica]|uniref:Secreted protein n=1 Tax=Stieleria maiorica TaxID=2795974 RepID=A0A5B9MI01_9BACT|nr:hypothetical protein [Stieleria maiorica]QEG00524.1 hypothetical protein Mal15_45940 [Stieleria maiorica]